jgi:hypothetical protein
MRGVQLEHTYDYILMQSNQSMPRLQVCFALLCFALLCFALLCFALLCFACFAFICFHRTSRITYVWVFTWKGGNSSSHFQVKPTHWHGLRTTTDNLSRHAYTLPCLMGGGSYDAVDTIDVQAPCWVATRQSPTTLSRQCGGCLLTPAKDLETRFVWCSTTTVQGGPH